jgi:hypothetical protein
LSEYQPPVASLMPPLNLPSLICASVATTVQSTAVPRKPAANSAFASTKVASAGMFPATLTSAHSSALRWQTCRSSGNSSVTLFCADADCNSNIAMIPQVLRR